tara:strand:- start:100 stop:687 length:588 start_codon:yes stop_codon:yes gene_type:complete
MAKGDFKLTPAREKELEKLAKDLPDSDFKKRYGKDWKSVKIATAMNILKKKYNYKEDKMNFKELREKYRSKFPSSLVSAAVKIALDMGGAMTPATKKIEGMKKGLSKDPAVKAALRLANENFSEVAENKEIPFGYTFFDKGDVNKFKRLIGGLKGLELVSTNKMPGGQTIVRVKGPKKIVAKANAFAIKVMSENV